MNIKDIIRDQQYTIVDVRTAIEFMSGNAAGSLNIPLQEIPHRLDELKNLNQPILLCCASGGRSAHATQYLLQEGINCYNGGSWLQVNNYQTETH